jgi:vitamin B12 transporter
VKLNPYLRYSRINSSLDADAFIDDKDYTSRLKNLQAGIKNEFILGKVKLDLLYNYNNIKRNYLNDSLIKETPLDGYSKGNYTGNEHFADVYVNIPLTASLTFTGGADYRNSKTDVKTSGVYKYVFDSVIYSSIYESNIGKDSAKQSQVGVYGEFNYTGKTGFNAAMGGRFNHHSSYGSNVVFNINPSYLINQQFKLFINISSGYKVPTLYQLYSEYRNPFTTLKPEKALTYEGGIQYFSLNNLFTARMTAFKRDVKDVIAFYTDPNTFNSYYINQDKQKDYGFEIESTINIKNKGQVILSYAFVDGKITTKNGSKDTSYFNLNKRPKHIISASVNYHITKLFVSGSIRSIGKRTDLDFSTYPAQTVELSAYYLVDFYAEYNFLKNVKAFFDLKNITNSSYSESLGYNTLGRNFTVGLAVHL